MRFEVTTPAPRDMWREIVASSDESVSFNTPEWVDCICKVDGCEDATRLYEFSDGNRMVMPMIRRRHVRGAVRSSASLPINWGGMGGLVGNRPVGVEHTRAVFRDLSETADALVDIWPNPIDDPVWAAGCDGRVIRVSRVSHILSLEGGFSTVWSQRFTSATRNHMRRAQRSPLVVECDSHGRLIPAFYQLFQLSLERWARQQHEPRFMAFWRAKQRDPLHKFYEIAQAMSSAFRLWIAWLDGLPVAGIIVFQLPNAVYSWGAMNKDLVKGLPANDLLQLHAIEAACEAGAKYYYMGESGENKALSHFKERLGGQVYPYSEYRIERFPITPIDNAVRGFGKRLIGFKDV